MKLKWPWKKMTPEVKRQVRLETRMKLAEALVRAFCDTDSVLTLDYSDLKLLSHLERWREAKSYNNANNG